MSSASWSIVTTGYQRSSGDTSGPPAHYIDAWLTLMDVDGWSPGRIAGLKEHLTRSAAAALATPEDDDEDPYSNRGG
jgi:uncharacterized membrane protein